MNKKIYDAVGIALLSFPTTRNNKKNNKRRNITDLKSTSAAHVISVTGIGPEKPLIFCGKYNKAIPVVRQLIKKSSRPFVILGTESNLREDSCLHLIDGEWKSNTITPVLPEGNGVMILHPGTQTNLELKECLPAWDSHLIILCLGNGLQVDQELLNLLNSVGHYILLSESLNRSVKSAEGTKLTAQDLLSSMEYIIVSSIGTAGKDLLKVLPDFEYEKIMNTMDFSLHQDAPIRHGGDHHHRNGGGVHFGQTRSIEPRCILTQEELTKLQDANTMIIHNAQNSHTWVARVTS
ncbi:MAG: hypothetical protein Q4F78_08510 [Bacillota bacterium]|nr:hypothetical protein [Bacillota bacterium]